MATFLSQTSEYALRAMAWIAAQPSREPIRARELADATQVPLQYLSKILRRLVLAGLLESRKGHGGGFTLGRPAREIRFRDVLIAMDAYPVKGRCAFGWEACDALQPCPLHGLWSELSEGFSAWAARASIAGARDAATRDRRPRRPGRGRRRRSTDTLATRLRRRRA